MMLLLLANAIKPNCQNQLLAIAWQPMMYLESKKAYVRHDLYLADG
ncbi:hypothetical protein [Floridanema evergladense]|uniref:Uncharacterized protein n=1 Tax=Floridaenema evergladense BLCC-F167 TaxID=3153639 RepID=A0ABV4WM50_9CYAN